MEQKILSSRKSKAGYKHYNKSVPFRVIFGDGTEICEPKAAKTFINALVHLGLEEVQRVSKLIPESQIQGYTVVSDEKRPEKKPNKWQDEIDGKYIFTKLTNERKKRIIELVAEKLNKIVTIQDIH